MTDHCKIAIVGSGPGGLSAAARAAELGISYLVIESCDHASNTIYLYQKGKFVMAEPAVLPLRSPLSFAAGTRESILEDWNRSIEAMQLNIRYQAEVTEISGEKGDFLITLKNGKQIHAEVVVLNIGLQGNLRKLGTSGEDLPQVQYQLDDPDEYQDETIVVVGAGDAAIENAIALASNNTVVIVNRRDEFNRAKQGNLDLIEKHIKDKSIECYYSSSVKNVLPLEPGTKPIAITLDTPNGEAVIECDRVIARLGAIPPRRFVESCGIEFPNDDPASVPALSSTYESNVDGLYIVGALAGYPLIKQALNQGYEVVEYICGNDVEPADEPLLREKFKPLKDIKTVSDVLAIIQRDIPLLSSLTQLQLREFMLDSDVHTPKTGEIIFSLNDYTDSFYTILSGEVKIQSKKNDSSNVITLTRGQFFGEMSLISGRRRSATVVAGEQCILIETPRRSMNKLIHSIESVKRSLDEVFLMRAIQSQLAPESSAELLGEVVKHAYVREYASGKALFNEGDEGDCLHLIRSGSVTVSRAIGGSEVVLSYLAAGNYVGEMALMGETTRNATVRAAVATETIELDGIAFSMLLEKDPTLRQRVEAEYQRRIAQNVYMEEQPEAGNIISFLVQQGLGEASDVLLIDESLCIGCNNCETACSETHAGTSRLDRAAGPTYASVHVPTSCRHCEHPHCMKDCPPDAIHRSHNGEVYIAENCIGCGNCKRNCPYGVIQMAVAAEHKPGLLGWMFLGIGPGPGKSRPGKSTTPGNLHKHAVKCDMCKDLPGGPACVRACPTGAAIRVSPEKFMSFTNIIA